MGNTAQNLIPADLFGGQAPPSNGEIVNDLVARAKGLAVTNDQQLESCKNMILTIKDMRAQIDNGYDPLIQAAHQSHKKALAKKKEFTAPLDSAERIARDKGDSYLTAKKQQEEEDRRKREEAARKEAAQKVAALNEKVAALTVGLSETTDKIAALRTRLVEVETTDEGAIIRSNIAVLEAGIENDAEAARMMQDQVEMELMTSAPVVEDEKVQGVSSVGTVNVEVTDMVSS